MNKNLNCADPVRVATSTEPSAVLRVLAIGNSFSVDGMEYLWDLCHEAGIGKVILGNLYIGGCTLQTHWNNICRDVPGYTYYTNTDGAWVDNGAVSVRQTLIAQAWDVITVQQASGPSGLAESYAVLPDILEYLHNHKTNPNARIFWHMTWAYQSDSTHGEFPNYGRSQSFMYSSILSAYQKQVACRPDITGLIPSGTAIQNLRSSYLGDTLTRDGFHLSYDRGRYTASLTWFAALTGLSPDLVDWVPRAYPQLARDLPAIREAVKNAMARPLAVTPSCYTAAP